jgi:hypothetical protein
MLKMYSCLKVSKGKSFIFSMMPLSENMICPAIGIAKVVSVLSKKGVAPLMETIYYSSLKRFIPKASTMSLIIVSGPCRLNDFVVKVTPRQVLAVFSYQITNHSQLM